MAASATTAPLSNLDVTDPAIAKILAIMESLQRENMEMREENARLRAENATAKGRSYLEDTVDDVSPICSRYPSSESLPTTPMEAEATPPTTEGEFTVPRQNGTKRRAVVSPPPGFEAANRFAVLEVANEGACSQAEASQPTASPPSKKPAIATKPSRKSPATTSQPPRPSQRSQPPHQREANVVNREADVVRREANNVVRGEATNVVRIPPIILREAGKWTRVSQLCANQRINFTKARTCADGINITTPDAETYRRLTKLLDQEKAQYHSFTLPEERTKRAVLRTVPVEVTPEEVMEDLKAQGFRPLKVSRMIRDRARTPLPLIMLEVPADVDPFEIKSVCRLVVTVEKPRKLQRTAQCHRCQKFRHAQHNCRADHRCVKCAGNHATASCKKRPEQPAKCANCGGPHTANYRGCPSFPKPYQRPRTTGQRPRRPANSRSYNLPEGNSRPLPRHPMPPPTKDTAPNNFHRFSELVAVVASASSHNDAILSLIGYLQNKKA